METSTDAQTSDETAFADIRTTLTKRRNVRFLSDFEGLLFAFSPAERLLLYILSVALGVAALVLLAGVNAKASVIVPSEGGVLTEGIVGTARFVNPLLAI